MADQARQMPDPEKFASMTLARCTPLEQVFCDLSGKVALVTGGATGLGYNVVNRLSEAGAKVVIASRSERRGGMAVDDFAKLGREVSFVACDVTRVEDCFAAVDFAVATYGGLDILVTAAAGWDECAYLDVDEATYDRVLDTDLKGSYFCAQAAARHMVAHGVKGKIVFISSAAHLGEGPRGTGMNTYYQSAKAGVVGLTTGVAGELMQYGINVNCVAPGGMLTHGCVFEGAANAARYGDEYKALKAEVRQHTQVPLAMNPDAVALAVYALCTPMADFMQGSTVDVNGGALLNAQRRPLSFTVEGCVPGPSAE